jgi:hypothetical protein
VFVGTVGKTSREGEEKALLKNGEVFDRADIVRDVQ